MVYFEAGKPHLRRTGGFSMSMNDSSAYEDELWTELIDGEVVMMAPAAMGHTFIAGNIYHIFRKYLQGKKCVPISDGGKVYLTEKDHFVPDMMVVCDRGKIGSDGVYGAPDLVVEVLSPSTTRNDRKHKKDVYGKCGVQEYWLVSPGEKSVEQYFLVGDRLELHEVYTLYPDWMLARMTEEERAAVVASFKCSLFDDLDIPLADIFENVGS